jgi:TRAP-type C4-dicarboxylate transport system permease small subunit
LNSILNIRNTVFWVILEKSMRAVLVICSTVSTGCILYAVLLRYVLNSNFYGSDEIILLFAFWLYFIGAAYGSYENSHIKADLLNMYVKNMRYKDGLNLIAQAVTVLVNCILLVWAFESFLWALEKMPLTTSLKIPIVIPKSAIFFGLLLMAFYHIFYLFENTVNFIRKGYFSTPQKNDYVSEKHRAKYPNDSTPTKSELLKMKEIEEKQLGGDN